MMKKFLVISAAMLLFSFAAGAQFRDGSAYADLYDSENVASMKEHVRYLSSSMIEGRAAGSEGEVLAADYVAEQFKRYGVDLLSPKGGDVFGVRRENGDTLTSRNVMGYVQGYDKELRDHFIVVGARLDNLGTMMMSVNGEPQQKILYGSDELHPLPPLGAFCGIRRFQ